MKLKLRLSRWPSWLLSVSTVLTLTSLLLVLDSAQSIRIRDGGSNRDPYEQVVLENPPQIYRRKPAGSLQTHHRIEDDETTSPVYTPTDLLLHYYGHSGAQVGQVTSRSQLKPKPKTVILGRSNYQPKERVVVLGSREQVEQVNEDDEVEDETDYNYGGGQESAETTTIRVQPQIPDALRRNFAQRPRASSSFERGVTTTLDTPTELYNETEPPPLVVKSSRKKNKTKNSSSSSSTGNGRRRKVKRPVKPKDKEVATASALKATTVSSPTADEDLDDKTPGSSGSSSNSTGEKNLALEIGSDDGKYALIDSFFNQTEVQQPGIISYKPSDDFEKDDEKTLGNLNQNEIWLSEGHLLVLKGGEFDATNKDVWPPIDNFQRRRKPPPLKIPLDTNNPPPFPVFVNDSGPPIFLREPPPFLPYPPPGFLGNDSNFDPSLLPPPGLIPLNPNGTIPQGLNFPPGGFGPLSGPPNGGLYGPPNSGGVNGNGGVGVNGAYGQGGNGPYGQGGNGPPPGNNAQIPPPFYPFLPPPGQGVNDSFPPPYPFPPPGNNGQNFPPPPPGYNQNFNGSGPPPQGFPFLPPLVLNPADNETDDPSIFLPPPYDFDYYEDNSTLVPPGPFAPGLVVPPPKDFYSVYNRTGRPPTVSATYHFFPTTAIPTTSSVISKKQRPNAKKPKFPITNPPDDSLEELYPIVTTPYPDTTIPTTKKRPKRPRTKKPFFPTDSGSAQSFEGGRVSSQESSEEITPPNSEQNYSPAPSPPPTTSNPSIIFPSYKTQFFNTSPRPNVVTVYPTSVLPTYRVKTSPSPPTTSTISTTATPKPTLNSFVYVQGRLTTLEEIAAEQAAEQDFDTNPGRLSTPRPPYDSRGYPTRVLDENNGPIIFEFPKKDGRKPTETPVKTYYQGTPKYDPNYGNLNQNPIQNPNSGNIQYTNQGPTILQQGPGPNSDPQQQPPTILYPSTVYSNAGVNVGRTTRVRNRNRNNQRLNQNSNNPQTGVPIYIDPQTGNGYYSNGNLVNIGPTYVTQTQQQQEPPQSQINFVEKQPQNPYSNINNNNNNNNNRPSVIVQSNPPNYLPPNTQIRANNGGFRPALPPPQQPQHQNQNQQIYNNQQQQAIYINNQRQRPNNRARVLFPGQVSIQQLNSPQQQQFSPDPSRVPIYSHSQRIPQSQDEDEERALRPSQEKTLRPRPTLKTFAPQGYYSPITNFQVDPTPTYSSPFIPSQYYSSQQQQPQQIDTNVNNNNNNGRGQPQYNYPAPVSVSNFQSDPTIPSRNYNIHGDSIQVYQPSYQQSHSQNNRAFTPQQLNTQQFIQPLYDDLRINYREPIPPYNEESESVTTRSVIKAGPAPGFSGDKLTSGSAPGTFYSFQRGGVGGFSYKIRL